MSQKHRRQPNRKERKNKNSAPPVRLDPQGGDTMEVRSYHVGGQYKIMSEYVDSSPFCEEGANSMPTGKENRRTSLASL